jgi:hypothetical protein
LSFFGSLGSKVWSIQAFHTRNGNYLCFARMFPIKLKRESITTPWMISQDARVFPYLHLPEMDAAILVWFRADGSSLSSTKQGE